jgi:hypothetical protein
MTAKACPRRRSVGFGGCRWADLVVTRFGAAGRADGELVAKVIETKLGADAVGHIAGVAAFFGEVGFVLAERPTVMRADQNRAAKVASRSAR